MKETAGQCWTVSRPTQKALEHGFNAVSFHTESMRCEMKFFPFLSSAAWILGDSGRVIKKGGVLECFNSSVLDVVK